MKRHQRNDEIGTTGFERQHFLIADNGWKWAFQEISVAFDANNQFRLAGLRDGVRCRAGMASKIDGDGEMALYRVETVGQIVGNALQQEIRTRFSARKGATAKREQEIAIKDRAIINRRRHGFRLLFRARFSTIVAGIDAFERGRMQWQMTIERIKPFCAAQAKGFDGLSA